MSTHSDEGNLEKGNFERGIADEGKRVILITGGTSGIGLACVKLFLRAGGTVATCSRRDFDFAPHLSPPEMERLVLSQVDVSQRGAASAWVESMHERLGRIDVLINNAAIAPMRPVTELTDDDFDNLMSTNMRAVFEATRSVFPLMRSQDAGSIGSKVIVNLSSMAAVDPFPGFSLYGASKAWIETFTRGLVNDQQELPARSQRLIHCFAIRAGAVATPLLESVLPNFPADQTLRPEQVAQLILKLVSDPESFENGAAMEIQYSGT